MRILSFLIIISFLSIQNFSCKKKPAAGEDYLLERAVSIYFRDSISNKLLIGKNGERFNPDTIKIYKNANTGASLVGSAVKDSIGEYACNILYFLEVASKQEDFEVVSLDLPIYIYFNNADTDTILIKKQPFTNVDVFWNNKPIVSIPPLTKEFPYLLTIKK